MNVGHTDSTLLYLMNYITVDPLLFLTNQYYLTLYYNSHAPPIIIFYVPLHIIYGT